MYIIIFFSLVCYFCSKLVVLAPFVRRYCCRFVVVSFLFAAISLVCLLISIRFSRLCLKIAFRAFHLIYTVAVLMLGVVRTFPHFSLHIQNQKLIFLVHLFFRCVIRAPALSFSCSHITFSFLYSLFSIWMCVCVEFLCWVIFLLFLVRNSSICKIHRGQHHIFCIRKSLKLAYKMHINIEYAVCTFNFCLCVLEAESAAKKANDSCYGRKLWSVLAHRNECDVISRILTPFFANF